MNKIDSPIVINSAKGTIIQTPFIPNILGKNMNPIITKTNALENDTIAEIFPFEYAVKIPDT